MEKVGRGGVPPQFLEGFPCEVTLGDRGGLGFRPGKIFSDQNYSNPGKGGGGGMGIPGNCSIPWRMIPQHSLGWELIWGSCRSAWLNSMGKFCGKRVGIPQDFGAGIKIPSGFSSPVPSVCLIPFQEFVPGIWSHSQVSLSWSFPVETLGSFLFPEFFLIPFPSFSFLAFAPWIQSHSQISVSQWIRCHSQISQFPSAIPKFFLDFSPWIRCHCQVSHSQIPHSQVPHSKFLIPNFSFPNFPFPNFPFPNFLTFTFPSPSATFTFTFSSCPATCQDLEIFFLGIFFSFPTGIFPFFSLQVSPRTPRSQIPCCRGQCPFNS